ncbi:MAG: DUF222 domain-containing protein [Actinobacteria bacterium]|nr:DUF222 domain-containing protein [Actinomycetota bacterium]
MRSPADNVIDPPSSTTSSEPPGPARPRARSDLTGLPAERLETEVVDLTTRMAAGTYELLVLVGELDRRGSWAAWGALSCAAWLADRCDIEICTARSQVRVARAMLLFPILDQAMANGDVSYAKARVLVPHLTSANADALLDLAERNPAGRLGAAIAAWSQRHEDAATIRARQHEARSLSWRTEPDGTVLLTARLTPEVAGAVCAVIDTAVTRTGAPAGASLAHQRADALAAVVTDGGGQVEAEVVVHVTTDGNHLPDGTPLSDHAVAQLLPDAFVSLLIHDTERQPIDASPRRRHPTRRQRRVLDARADQCQHPGCTARAFLQYDHVQPYTEGGPTTIDNLQRLCGPHNRQRTRSREPGR